MPQSNLESFTNRGVLVKTETTEGTDAAPVEATDGLMLLDGSSGTEFDKVERSIDKAFFSGNEFAVANRRAFIEGDVEIFPPDAPGDAVNGISHQDAVLKAGGMARTLDATNGTTTYNPISSSFESVTAYWWHVDHHLEVLGARANITGLMMAIGQIAKMRMRLQGSYDQMEKEALPTNIVLPDFVPQALESDNSVTTIASVDGTTVASMNLWGKSISIDFNNSLAQKEYTEAKFNTISDRLATWSLQVARADLDEFNPWQLRDDGVLMEGDITQTYVDLDLSVKLAFRGQIESVETVDIDGDLGWQLSGPCIASSAGGDEFFLEYNDLSLPI
jgi:hypothetical protein